MLGGNVLAATAEALADRSSACRRQGPPRTAPSAASRRRPRALWCPAPHGRLQVGRSWRSLSDLELSKERSQIA